MRYLSAFLVFSLLWACNSAPEQKPRPESLLFKKSINAWQAKNDSGQVILWTNLEILGILNSDTLSQQINTQVQENLLLSNITSDLDVNSYEALHDSMALEFNRLAAQGFAGPEPWELRQSVDVVCNQNGLFGYQSLHSNYTGGVSASFYTAAQLFRISDGALLSLDSLVRPETWEDFLLLSESLFRQQNGMPETGDFETMGLMFENNEFHLGENFVYDTAGIYIHYNTNEIAPRLRGEFRVRMPYDYILPFIRPEYHLLKPEENEIES
jgi:hypothetical protein